jgi:hypothetical protein
MLFVAGLATAVAAPAWASELPDAAVNAGAGHAATDRAVDAESVARANWRSLMAHNSTPAAGCFHASYPNIVWEKVACKTGQPRVHPVHAKLRDDEAEVTGGLLNGNNNDYAAKATGLITEAFGSFAISGVTAEDGVAEFYIGNVPQGSLGPNEYSIQLNTNGLSTTSACSGHSSCRVWQQFVYATDYLGLGDAAEVFMQYWLINWDATCPAGWNTSGPDCWANGPLTPAPNVPITDLGNVVFSGSATPGGTDTVSFTYESEAYSASFGDFVLDISSVWNRAEFNVVGSGGGSRAEFNFGSSITVSLYLSDGSTSKPTCLVNAGTTGESNNLDAGPCTAYGGYIPYIRFTEKN